MRLPLLLLSLLSLAVASPWFDAVTAVQKASPAALRALSCAECELIVGVAGKIANNKTLAAEATAAASTLCASKLNGTLATVCEGAAKVLLEDVLPWVWKQTDTLAWPQDSALCSVIVKSCPQPCCTADTVPEQRHLALTHNASHMLVSWVTLNDTSSTVLYGTSASALNAAAHGGTHTYSFGAWVGHIHQATMVGLAPNTEYFYKVGDGTTWSDVTSFRTLPADITLLRIAQIGDTGYGNASDATLAALTARTDAGDIDVLMHVGDVGYADGYAPHDDAWGRKIEPVASRVPYMTAPGNHELWANFTAYKARFGAAMPTDASSDGMYYSLDFGSLLHWSMLDTESAIDTPDVSTTQASWLAADLEAAASSSWRITAGHRPLYCSFGSKTQCGLFSAILQAQVEDILHAHGVELVIQCHMHNMELTKPLYHGVETPGAPTYIVNGAGGNREGDTNVTPAPWSAWHTPDNGYGYITVNASALVYDFVATNSTVLQRLTLTK